MAGASFSVDCGLLDSRKFWRLRAKLGEKALEVLIRLWSYTRTVAPSGDLGDPDPEFLAMAVRWTGEPQLLWDALVGGEWVDLVDGRLVVHDWGDHNWFATTLEKRRVQARENVMRRWDKRNRSGGQSDTSGITPPITDGNTSPNASGNTPANTDRNTSGYTNRDRDKIKRSHTYDGNTSRIEAAPVPPHGGPSFSDENQGTEKQDKKTETPEGQTPDPATDKFQKAARNVLKALGRDDKSPLRKPEIAVLRRILKLDVSLDVVEEAVRRKQIAGVFKKGLDYLEPVILELHEEEMRQTKKAAHG
jgi:hypothetical protein